MKLPLEWVREYVDIDVDVEALAERLTASGTEVVGMTVTGRAWDRVVVGSIDAIRKHPNADRLTICDVADGEGVRQVVCGASNFAVGDKVALALPGADFGDGFVIKESKLRGVPSAGMLCAEDELGLTDDHDGILILPADATVGAPLAAVLGTPEPVLDLDITWNRPDCLSIIGLAREIAAMLGVPLRRPDVALREDTGWAVGDALQVSVEDQVACPRYTGRALADVEVRPAPLWMRRRLFACGIRPINNLVDVTNYVLLECGQPLHAFDRRFLQGDTIVVRHASADECIETLDGVERRLRDDMLLIADAKTAVAVAGVMGGAGSEIRDDTTAVILESACFQPASVKHTSTALGLDTESSHRFERGVDVENVEWASRRAAGLMLATAGGRCATGVVDVIAPDLARRQIVLRFGRVMSLLGIDVPRDEILAILASLELHATESGPDSCCVEIPAFRPDLEREADLLEEIARVHGIDQVPTAAPGSRQVSMLPDTRFRALQRCRDLLVGMGLAETMNYSFLAERALARFSGREAWVEIPNPVSADHAYLRDSLLPQMLESLARNWSRQVHNTALFEVGRTFHPGPAGVVVEEDRIAVGLMGAVGSSGQGTGRVRREDAFLRAKGVLESLVAGAGAGTLTLRPVALAWAEKGYSVEVVLGDKVLGYMGLLNSEVARQWRMSLPVMLAEMSADTLLEHAFRVPALHSVTTQPAMERDVALVAPLSLTHEQIVTVMRDAAPSELTGIRLFDIFESEGVGDGQRSMAYALTFRSEQKTLTDEEANAFADAIKDALKRKLKVEIREG